MDSFNPNNRYNLPREAYRIHDYSRAGEEPRLHEAHHE